MEARIESDMEEQLTRKRLLGVMEADLWGLMELQKGRLKNNKVF